MFLHALPFRPLRFCSVDEGRRPTTDRRASRAGLPRAGPGSNAFTHQQPFQPAPGQARAHRHIPEARRRAVRSTPRCPAATQEIVAHLDHDVRQAAVAPVPTDGVIDVVLRRIRLVVADDSAASRRSAASIALGHAAFVGRDDADVPRPRDAAIDRREGVHGDEQQSAGARHGGGRERADGSVKRRPQGSRPGLRDRPRRDRRCRESAVSSERGVIASGSSGARLQSITRRENCCRTISPPRRAWRPLATAAAPGSHAM